MPDVVTILSGGIDSTTLVFKLSNEGYKVHAVTFVYGQKHTKEIEAAHAVSKIAGISHRIVDISNINQLIDSSALINSSIAIPDVPEAVEFYDTLKSTIVPNRNAIFLSLAVAYALNVRANHVAYGAHFSDRGVYPDCRVEFVDAFAHAERVATENYHLEILAPFVDLTKAQIVGLGSKLKVPFEVTWSCYKGRSDHCGVCSSCRERKRAFSEAGVHDPTEYEK